MGVGGRGGSREVGEGECGWSWSVGGGGGGVGCWKVGEGESGGGGGGSRSLCGGVSGFLGEEGGARVLERERK